MKEKSLCWSTTIMMITMANTRCSTTKACSKKLDDAI